MADEREGIKDLLELVARALVDDPGSVVVTEVESDDATVYELKVSTGDLGKVIGKQGRTARAIRTILGSAGTKQRKRIVFEILE